jgi:hypothetical protein
VGSGHELAGDASSEGMIGVGVIGLWSANWKMMLEGLQVYGMAMKIGKRIWAIVLTIHN